MDNFSIKPKKHPNRTRTIDGILGTPPPRQTHGGGSKRQASNQIIGSGRARIDDFRRGSGFHPLAQPVIRSVAHTPPIETPAQSLLGEQFKPRKSRIKLTKARRFRRFAKRSSLALAAVVVLTGGFLVIKGYLNARNIFKGGGDSALALQEGIDPSKLKGEGDGRVNILVLGKGGPGQTAPDLTDTIIVASINPIGKEAGLLSIPRDLYVKIPGDGSDKINAAYVYGKNKVLAQNKPSATTNKLAEEAGLKAIEEVVEQSMGIPIHYYVMIDFEGFKQAINSVGGVDLNAPSSLFENMLIDGRPYTLNIKPGVQHFDGTKALAYARSRQTSARGDFDRSERQRLISIALKDKILSLGTLANPVKINELIGAFGNHMQSNLSTDEVIQLYNLSKQIPSTSIVSIGLADPPNDYVHTANINGLSVVVPKAGVNNFSEIQNYIRNTLKDGFIKNENASISVLNGSTKEGKATTKANELKSYGYNVINVADSPVKGNAKTILVVRNPDKKYTKHYLEKRLGVSATSNMPDGTIPTNDADFVIILGSD